MPQSGDFLRSIRDSTVNNLNFISQCNTKQPTISMRPTPISNKTQNFSKYNSRFSKHIAQPHKTDREYPQITQRPARSTRGPFTCTSPSKTTLAASLRPETPRGGGRVTQKGSIGLDGGAAFC